MPRGERTIYNSRNRVAFRKLSTESLCLVSTAPHRATPPPDSLALFMYTWKDFPLSEENKDVGYRNKNKRSIASKNLLYMRERRGKKRNVKIAWRHSQRPWPASKYIRVRVSLCSARISGREQLVGRVTSGGVLIAFRTQQDTTWTTFSSQRSLALEFLSGAWKH